MIQFAWHVHHGRLLEALTKPIEERQQFIRNVKEEKEIELRLRLLKPIKGVLPEEYVKASELLFEARKSFAVKSWAINSDASKNFSQAWKNREKMFKAHRHEIEALHTIECTDCPWDGHTIFPGQGD